jgi:putative transposase
MKRSRFTEEQIIGVLREQEAGAKTVEVCRKHGISDATFYKWKAKYGGLEVSEARRLKALEDENAKLKKLLAEGCSTTRCCGTWPQENGDARRQTRGHRSPLPGPWGEPAAGMPGARGGPQLHPLPQPSTR